ncbi:golgin subfamily A member 6-like protein 1 isoform X2 [Manduca sexta]|uniref:golgin subfamily A member 6-like protein 1 isoform X2 n=1 Tax=Manduca sexta TaxID=7130 RepID=UPI001181EC15|nr:golgin subfamily A member 6-like protein 1 isoform X2 [Manduca sexta]
MEGKTELQKNAIQEARRKELESYQRALDTEWLDSRMDDGRMGRCIALIQRESEMEKEFLEAEENYANAVLQKALYSDKEALEKEEKEKIDRSAQYCKELQQQLVSRQQQRQCEYEDTLIEKKMLEEVSRTMADEDQRELQKKRVETEKLRQEMVTSVQARQDWKDKQKEMIVIEERQIEQQRQAASDRSSSVIAERERKMQMKEEFHQKIGAKNLFDEEARMERENIIQLLQEQEYLEKNTQDDITEQEKAIRIKKEMMEALTNQMESKKREVLKQKEVEAEFRKQTEAIIAADDEKEREKAIQMKEKGREYSQQLRQQIEDNARRRHTQGQLEQARVQHVWDRDTDWRSEVAEERSKIVSEHAPKVLGSLQAGTLAHSDLPALREGASKSPELGQLDIDAVARSSGVQRKPKCNDQCRIIREY